MPNTKTDSTGAFSAGLLSGSSSTQVPVTVLAITATREDENRHNTDSLPFFTGASTGLPCSSISGPLSIPGSTSTGVAGSSASSSGGSSTLGSLGAGSKDFTNSVPGVKTVKDFFTKASNKNVVSTETTIGSGPQVGVKRSSGSVSPSNML